MNTIMRAGFRAKNHKEAVEIAEKLWRDFTGDPEAELPWDATLSANAESIETGTMDGHTEEHIVTWEFDMTARLTKTNDE